MQLRSKTVRPQPLLNAALCFMQRSTYAVAFKNNSTKSIIECSLVLLRYTSIDWCIIDYKYIYNIYINICLLLSHDWFYNHVTRNPSVSSTTKEDAFKKGFSDTNGFWLCCLGWAWVLWIQRIYIDEQLFKISSMSAFEYIYVYLSYLYCFVYETHMQWRSKIVRPKP